MPNRNNTGLFLATLMFTCWTTAACGQASDPSVKKSRQGICHEIGSGTYGRTKHFEPFDSMDKCLKSGGRLSKNEKPENKKRPSVCSGKVPVIGDEDVIFGRVISVTDGDTFKAKIQGATMTFRMADIDAPERDQPYGPEAQTMLSAALDGKDVVMLRVDNDPYSRLVVHVWIANLHINREIVARGAAWFDREYSNDDCLFQVENEARDAKRGLWALPGKRVEPWIWRHRSDGPAAAQPL